jgi:subtilisin family serine protease
MKRLMVAALLVSSVSAVANIPTSVSAVVDEQPEPIARTFVTTSPQLSGPGGVVPWGLDRIDQRNAVTANRSYSFTSTGTGVNVYIVDSGVDADHPEFGSRVQNGWSYRTSSTALASYSSALAAYQQNPATGIKPCTLDRARYSHEVDPSTFDNPPAVVPSDLGRTDNDGHGTHVAGIATGDSVGVAKNATIIPVRVMDSCGSGSSTMIAEGLRWVLADHDPGERAVVNLSIGFGSRVASIDNAIVDLMNEGILSPQLEIAQHRLVTPPRQILLIQSRLVHPRLQTSRVVSRITDHV